MVMAEISIYGYLYQIRLYHTESIAVKWGARETGRNKEFTSETSGNCEILSGRKGSRKFTEFKKSERDSRSGRNVGGRSFGFIPQIGLFKFNVHTKPWGRGC